MNNLLRKLYEGSEVVVKAELFMGDVEDRTFTVHRNEIMNAQMFGCFGNKLYRISYSDVEYVSKVV